MQLEREEGTGSTLRRRWARLGWWKWLLLALIILGGLSAVVHARSGRGTMAMVQTDKAMPRWIEQSVMCSGRLESITKQEFFTPEDTTVMELKVKVGDPVKKGQVLGRLDTAELTRNYEEARAKMANLEASLARASANDDGLALEAAEARYQAKKNYWQRTEKLYQAGAVSAADLEAARSDYVQAQADYELAKIKAAQQATAKDIASWQAGVQPVLWPGWASYSACCPPIRPHVWTPSRPCAGISPKVTIENAADQMME